LYKLLLRIDVVLALPIQYSSNHTLAVRVWRVNVLSLTLLALSESNWQISLKKITMTVAKKSELVVELVQKLP